MTRSTNLTVMKSTNLTVQSAKRGVPKGASIPQQEDSLAQTIRGFLGSFGERGRK
jgi:hypothetical protein